MQLCDYNASSSYGATQCQKLGGGCQGSNNTNCYPYIVWSDKQVDSTHHWSPELNGGKFFEWNGDAGHTSTNASSVRCVLDLICILIYIQTGLQLCDAWESSKYGAAQCLNLSGGCQGATGDNGNPNCYPFDVWSSQPGSGGVYYWRGLNNGSFNENTRVSTYAFSVRCVLDLIYI